MNDGGKGSKPRPFSVSQEKFAQNWDAIFGKNKDLPQHGAQRVNQAGQLEQYQEGYWLEIENRR